MPTQLDQFVDVMLRDHADQLYLLPDEHVTIVKDGKPRRVSKQPLTALPPLAARASARGPRASVIAAAPMVESPSALPDLPAAAHGSVPGEFASSEFQAAEQKLGKLLTTLVQSGSSDLHLRVGEP